MCTHDIFWKRSLSIILTLTRATRKHLPLQSSDTSREAGLSRGQPRGVRTAQPSDDESRMCDRRR